MPLVLLGKPLSFRQPHADAQSYNELYGRRSRAPDVETHVLSQTPGFRSAVQRHVRAPMWHAAVCREALVKLMQQGNHTGEIPRDNLVGVYPRHEEGAKPDQKWDEVLRVSASPNAMSSHGSYSLRRSTPQGGKTGRGTRLDVGDDQDIENDLFHTLVHLPTGELTAAAMAICGVSGDGRAEAAFFCHRRKDTRSCMITVALCVDASSVTHTPAGEWHTHVTPHHTTPRAPPTPAETGVAKGKGDVDRHGAGGKGKSHKGIAKFLRLVDTRNRARVNARVTALRGRPLTMSTTNTAAAVPAAELDTIDVVSASKLQATPCPRIRHGVNDRFQGISGWCWPISAGARGGVMFGTHEVASVVDFKLPRGIRVRVCALKAHHTQLPPTHTTHGFKGASDHDPEEVFDAVRDVAVDNLLQVSLAPEKQWRLMFEEVEKAAHRSGGMTVLVRDRHVQVRVEDALRTDIPNIPLDWIVVYSGMWRQGALFRAVSAAWYKVYSGEARLPPPASQDLGEVVGLVRSVVNSQRLYKGVLRGKNAVDPGGENTEAVRGMLTYIHRPGFDTHSRQIARNHAVKPPLGLERQWTDVLQAAEEATSAALRCEEEQEMLTLGGEPWRLDMRTAHRKILHTAYSTVDQHYWARKSGLSTTAMQDVINAARGLAQGGDESAPVERALLLVSREVSRAEASEGGWRQRAAWWAAAEVMAAAVVGIVRLSNKGADMDTVGEFTEHLAPKVAGRDASVVLPQAGDGLDLFEHLVEAASNSIQQQIDGNENVSAGDMLLGAMKGRLESERTEQIDREGSAGQASKIIHAAGDVVAKQVCKHPAAVRASAVHTLLGVLGTLGPQGWEATDSFIKARSRLFADTAYHVAKEVTVSLHAPAEKWARHVLTVPGGADSKKGGAQAHTFKMATAAVIVATNVLRRNHPDTPLDVITAVRDAASVIVDMGDHIQRNVQRAWKTLKAPLKAPQWMSGPYLFALLQRACEWLRGTFNKSLFENIGERVSARWAATDDMWGESDDAPAVVSDSSQDIVMEGCVSRMAAAISVMKSVSETFLSTASSMGFFPYVPIKKPHTLERGVHATDHATLKAFADLVYNAGLAADTDMQHATARDVRENTVRQCVKKALEYTEGFERAGDIPLKAAWVIYELLVKRTGYHAFTTSAVVTDLIEVRASLVAILRDMEQRMRVWPMANYTLREALVHVDVDLANAPPLFAGNDHAETQEVPRYETQLSQLQMLVKLDGREAQARHPMPRAPRDAYHRVNGIIRDALMATMGMVYKPSGARSPLQYFTSVATAMYDVLEGDVIALQEEQGALSTSRGEALKDQQARRGELSHVIMDVAAVVREVMPFKGKRPASISIRGYVANVCAMELLHDREGGGNTIPGADQLLFAGGVAASRHKTAHTTLQFTPSHRPAVRLDMKQVASNAKGGPAAKFLSGANRQQRQQVAGAWRRIDWGKAPDVNGISLSYRQATGMAETVRKNRRPDFMKYYEGIDRTLARGQEAVMQLHWGLPQTNGGATTVPSDVAQDPLGLVWMLTSALNVADPSSLVSSANYAGATPHGKATVKRVLKITKNMLQGTDVNIQHGPSKRAKEAFERDWGLKQRGDDSNAVYARLISHATKVLVYFYTQRGFLRYYPVKGKDDEYDMMERLPQHVRAYAYRAVSGLASTKNKNHSGAKLKRLVSHVILMAMLVASEHFVRFVEYGMLSQHVALYTRVLKRSTHVSSFGAHSLTSNFMNIFSNMALVLRQRPYNVHDFPPWAKGATWLCVSLDESQQKRLLRALLEETTAYEAKVKEREKNAKAREEELRDQRFLEKSGNAAWGGRVVGLADGGEPKASGTIIAPIVKPLCVEWGLTSAVIEQALSRRTWDDSTYVLSLLTPALKDAEEASVEAAAKRAADAARHRNRMFGKREASKKAREARNKVRLDAAKSAAREKSVYTPVPVIKWLRKLCNMDVGEPEPVPQNLWEAVGFTDADMSLRVPLSKQLARRGISSKPGGLVMEDVSARLRELDRLETRRKRAEKYEGTPSGVRVVSPLADPTVVEVFGESRAVDTSTTDTTTLGGFLAAMFGSARAHASYNNPNVAPVWNRAVCVLLGERLMRKWIPFDNYDQRAHSLDDGLNHMRSLFCEETFPGTRLWQARKVALDVLMGGTDKESYPEVLTEMRKVVQDVIVETEARDPYEDAPQPDDTDEEGDEEGGDEGGEGDGNNNATQGKEAPPAPADTPHTAAGGDHSTGAAHAAGGPDSTDAAMGKKESSGDTPGGADSTDAAPEKKEFSGDSQGGVTDGAPSTQQEAQKTGGTSEEGAKKAQEKPAPHYLPKNAVLHISTSTTEQASKRPMTTMRKTRITPEAFIERIVDMARALEYEMKAGTTFIEYVLSVSRFSTWAWKPPGRAWTNQFENNYYCPTHAILCPFVFPRNWWEASDMSRVLEQWNTAVPEPVRLLSMTDAAAIACDMPPYPLEPSVGNPMAPLRTWRSINFVRHANTSEALSLSARKERDPNTPSPYENRGLPMTWLLLNNPEGRPGERVLWEETREKELRSAYEQTYQRLNSVSRYARKGWAHTRLRGVNSGVVSDARDDLVTRLLAIRQPSTNMQDWVGGLRDILNNQAYQYDQERDDVMRVVETARKTFNWHAVFGVTTAAYRHAGGTPSVLHAASVTRTLFAQVSDLCVQMGTMFFMQQLQDHTRTIRTMYEESAMRRRMPHDISLGLFDVFGVQGEQHMRPSIRASTRPSSRSGAWARIHHLRPNPEASLGHNLPRQVDGNVLNTLLSRLDGASGPYDHPLQIRTPLDAFTPVSLRDVLPSSPSDPAGASEVAFVPGCVRGVTRPHLTTLPMGGGQHSAVSMCKRMLSSMVRDQTIRFVEDDDEPHGRYGHVLESGLAQVHTYDDSRVLVPEQLVVVGEMNVYGYMEGRGEVNGATHMLFVAWDWRYDASAHKTQFAQLMRWCTRNCVVMFTTLSKQQLAQSVLSKHAVSFALVVNRHVLNLAPAHAHKGASTVLFDTLYEYHPKCAAEYKMRLREAVATGVTKDVTAYAALLADWTAAVVFNTPFNTPMDWSRSSPPNTHAPPLFKRLRRLTHDMLERNGDTSLAVGRVNFEWATHIQQSFSPPPSGDWGEISLYDITPRVLLNLCFGDIFRLAEDGAAPAQTISRLLGVHGRTQTPYERITEFLTRAQLDVDGGALPYFVRGQTPPDGDGIASLL